MRFGRLVLMCVAKWVTWQLTLSKSIFTKVFRAQRQSFRSAPKPVVLQRKDNKDQLGQNIESNYTEYVLVQLSTACKSVEKRVKLIRLADKSEHGWYTVYGYLSDNFASGLDEQKRIKRAENEAGKKGKRRQAEFL